MPEYEARLLHRGPTYDQDRDQSWSTIQVYVQESVRDTFCAHRERIGTDVLHGAQTAPEGQRHVDFFSIGIIRLMTAVQEIVPLFLTGMLFYSLYRVSRKHMSLCKRAAIRRGFGMDAGYQAFDACPPIPELYGA